MVAKRSIADDNYDGKTNTVDQRSEIHFLLPMLCEIYQSKIHEIQLEIDKSGMMALALDIGSKLHF